MRLYTSKSLILVKSFLTIATNFSNKPVVLGIFYDERWRFRALCFSLLFYSSCSIEIRYVRIWQPQWETSEPTFIMAENSEGDRSFSGIGKLTMQRLANVSAQNLVADEMTSSIYHRPSILYDNFNQESRLFHTFY